MMAVPYRILVILHLVVVLPSSSRSQYAMLMKKDLEISVFDHSTVPDACSGVLKNAGPNYYRYLQFLGDYLYIGAMNCLLRLSVADFKLNNSRKFSVDETDRWRCSVQRPDDELDCQNHIRAVMPDCTDDSKLFVCGTGSYNPKRYTLDDSSLNDSTSESGTHMCPFDPLDNVTSIYIDTGNVGNRPAYYFGVYSDFLKSQPVIYRPGYTVNNTLYPDLLPAKSDVTWLNAPQFVGSFDIKSFTHGNQVFFFFREIAEEYTASKTKIFSRVAKVCKNDHGGGSLEGQRKKKWLSYQKARLNCSSPGYEPFYFDDIYDVYEAGDNFYALFYKQGPARQNSDDLSSSAICVYSKADIFRVFGGSFRHLVNKTWVTLPENDTPNPRLDDCKIHDETPSRFDGKVSKYQLMEENVNPIHGEPIFYKSGIQFLKLIVVDAENGTGSNIYVASDTGEIYNIFVYNCSDSSVIVHVNSIFKPLEDPNPIWSMKLKDDSLFLGTDYSVTKVSLDVCTKYKLKDSCIHDVHCFWCNDSGLCQSDTVGCANPKNFQNYYGSVANKCHDYDVAEALNETVFCVYSKPIEGLYETLDINFKLQRSGPAVWKKDDQEIFFREHDRYMLANDGALIIRNLSESDNGNFTAFDTVYQKVMKVACYIVTVNKGDTPDELKLAWEQAFIEWSSSYQHWKACSKPYLNECNAND